MEKVNSENDSADLLALTNGEAQALDTLTKYFKESPCFDIRSDIEMEYSQSEVAKSASDAIDALLLLEEFPLLSSSQGTPSGRCRRSFHRANRSGAGGIAASQSRPHARCASKL